MVISLEILIINNLTAKKMKQEFFVAEQKKSFSKVWRGLYQLLQSELTAIYDYKRK